MAAAGDRPRFFVVGVVAVVDVVADVVVVVPCFATAAAGVPGELAELAEEIAAAPAPAVVGFRPLPASRASAFSLSYCG